MGQVKSCVGDARERGCWSAVLYPKVAPEWYRKLVSGVGSQDVHVQPAPEGSLLLLGHISLSVPDLQPTNQYWIESGVRAGRSCHEVAGQEVRVNLGPSQCRFPLAQGQPQKWPGEICIWVEDIRQTTDFFNMLGQTFGTDIVSDVKQAPTGGEFMLKLRDPFRQFFVYASECPRGWAPKLRAIGHDPSTADAEYPPRTMNPVALIDATVLISSRAVMLGVCRFYQHYLMQPLAPPGPSQYSVQVHFGPGEGLHQTLTFLQDPAVPSYSNLGSICIYVKDRGAFIRIYARCKAAGLLKNPELTREDVNRDCEFSLRAIQDPETKGDIIPLEHVIRHPGHPDCHVSPDPRTSSKSA